MARTSGTWAINYRRPAAAEATGPGHPARARTSGQAWPGHPAPGPEIRRLCPESARNLTAQARTSGSSPRTSGSPRRPGHPGRRPDIRPLICLRAAPGPRPMYPFAPKTTYTPLLIPFRVSCGFSSFDTCVDFSHETGAPLRRRSTSGFKTPNGKIPRDSKTSSGRRLSVSPLLTLDHVSRPCIANLALV